jgi:DNA-binding transcriptional LysR family regulator
MSAAAKALYITQPAVSMAVRQLERQLGQPLLVRSSKGVAATAEGVMLYGYLDRALRLISAAEEKFKAMADMELGEVKIGASDTLLSHYLIHYIEKFTRAYPSIAIKATNRTTPETVENLRSGTVDIGFVNLPLEDADGLDIKYCLAIHDCLIGGKKYSRLAEKGLHISEMRDYPLLLLENDSASRRYINAYAEGNGVKLAPCIELGSSDLLVQFARINLGLAFVTREFTLRQIDGETLFEVPVSPEIPPRHVGMATLKGVRPGKAASVFAEMLTSP